MEVGMKKTSQKNNETGKLKELLKKYVKLAPKMEKIENEIYQILKKRLQIFPEETSRTAWLFIEGMTITEEEGKVIKLILEKRDYKFQEAA
jgi:hypothetical protein